MKFGTFFGYMRKEAKEKDLPLEKVLTNMRNLGLTHTDVGFTDITDLGGKELFRLLQNTGITISSAYHFLSLPHEGKVLSDAIKEKTKEHLFAYGEAEIPLIMPMPILDRFPTKEAAQEAQVAYLSYLVEEANPYGITVSVENFSNPKNPLATLEGLSYLFSHLPDCRFVLDTGNFWFHRVDLPAAQIALKDSLVHVHLQDFLENKDGHLTIEDKTVEGVAIGSGFLPIAHVIANLKEQCYTGVYNIEISHNTNPLDRVRKSMDFLKVL